ncbi:MAG: hypothetical protein ABEJ27_00105 [Halodesulfurarchaeum sp.]
MDTDETVADPPSTVDWRHLSPDEITAPIVQSVPYLELKLEHPGLEPSGHSEQFFPDAVPYRLDATPRVFYWRSALSPSADDPGAWELACATTHDLVGLTPPTDGPSLVTEGANGWILVVDGTIAGDATTSHVAAYSNPTLTVEAVSDTTIALTVNGTETSVSIGERRRIRLAGQSVEPVPDGGASTTVTPELVARFPGRRELHHPARGASYRLFPSFDLTLEDLPNPLAVPTTAGELDDAALATNVGVDLSQRPYPERILWQAFTYTAFDPHAGATSGLTQLDTGHHVVRTVTA